MADLGKILLTPKGEYDASKEYEYLDVVTFNESSYVCKVQKSQGVNPDNELNWQLMCRGGGSGGVSYYALLPDKPQIEGITLASGNNTAESLGLAKKSDIHTVWKGTKAEWDSDSGNIPKSQLVDGDDVIITDDYVASIKSTVADCIASTRDEDVVGASAFTEANTYSTDKVLIGKFFGRNLYRKCFELSSAVTLVANTYSAITEVNISNVKELVALKITNTPTASNMSTILNSAFLARFQNNVLNVMNSRASDIQLTSGCKVIVEYTEN